MKTQLLALATVAAALMSVDASAATAYSAITAPDADSRVVLAHPFTNVSQWKKSSGGMEAAVHASFAQIIEQNFAKLDADGAAALLHSLSDLELAHLSQLYTNAVTDAGGTSHLQNILASRLEPTDLARASKYLGYAAMASAVSTVAPQKAFAFGQLADVRTMAPTPGAQILTLRSMQTTPNVGGIGQFFNYTPNEIYLSFRTAPVGAMGVAGALFETGVVIAGGVYAAYQGGYWAGSQLSKLIGTYDPALQDAIGGTITQMIDNFNNSWNQMMQGNWQQTLGTTFPLTSVQRRDEISFGGDFGVATDWEFSAGGSGKCGYDPGQNCRDL